MQKSINSSLPLTESTLFILLSLAPKPLHGYAIMKNVLDISRGRVNMTAGTLYGALKRLLEQDWIERIPGDEEEPGNPGLPRKIYRLTKKGHDVLNAESERLLAVIEVLRLHKSEVV